MNIIIPKEKTPNGKYTKEAQTEIKKQVLVFVSKICEESERMELSSTNDINLVQITPHTIQRAVKYVIEERVEKKKDPIFIDYICPGIQGLIALILAIMPFFDFQKKWAAVSLGVVYIIFLVIQITYKSK
ncbi:hypothetical protein [Phocaeicola barnesiae]|uniref:hypothetical protein n=1 Tax=Phocaeicola barnesiae TaxID=376804 RepID=UPI00046F2B6A|nr:hypothetical protein [Phocaeicola barnesiae]